MDENNSGLDMKASRSLPSEPRNVVEQAIAGQSRVPPQLKARVADVIYRTLTDHSGAGERIPGTTISRQGLTKLMAVLRERAGTQDAFWHRIAKRLYQFLTPPPTDGEQVVAGANISQVKLLLEYVSNALPPDQRERLLAGDTEPDQTPDALDLGNIANCSLTEIANFHGTDKGTLGPSEEWGGNNYADIYDAYFCQLRNSPIRLLEIGLGVTGESFDSKIDHGRNLGGGGSMKMWYDYFTNADIYGIDINHAGHLDNDRINTYVADQGNVEQLEAFIEFSGGGSFDIIVEDGTHRPDHQQISLGFFFQHLKPGGLYVVEDLRNNGRGDAWPWPEGCCDDILNTRRVLRSFQKTGHFEKPNGLVNAEYLAEQIDYMVFHSPFPRAARRKKNPMFVGVEYLPGTERLCALRKK